MPVFPRAAHRRGYGTGGTKVNDFIRAAKLIRAIKGGRGVLTRTYQQQQQDDDESAGEHGQRIGPE